MTLSAATGLFLMLITNNSTAEGALIGAGGDGCGVIERHGMIVNHNMTINSKDVMTCLMAS